MEAAFPYNVSSQKSFNNTDRLRQNIMSASGSTGKYSQLDPRSKSQLKRITPYAEPLEDNSLVPVLVTGMGHDRSNIDLNLIRKSVQIEQKYEMSFDKMSKS